jgi:3-oxoacyl-[acyl-carrier protein] reductase
MTSGTPPPPNPFHDEWVSRTPSGRASLPQDLANAIVFLGSPANGNVMGAYLPVNGGNP